MNYNPFISYTILIIYTILLGFLSAIPIGAVQLHVVRKALRGMWRPALFTALGSGTSDLVYGLIMLFGLGDILMTARFQIFFYLLGIAVLGFLIYRSIRELRHPAADECESSGVKNNGHGYGFLTGFTLAITNPGIALWWIVGFKVFMDIGIFTGVTVPLRLVFVISGVSGLVGYLALLVLVVTRIHRNLSENLFRRLNLLLIMALAALILYFIWKIGECIA
jgi:threonine/homoserine/homoserine lactone efflux protein